MIVCTLTEVSFSNLFVRQVLIYLCDQSCYLMWSFKKKKKAISSSLQPLTTTKYLIKCWILTCILLRGHRRAYDIIEVFEPILLVALCLASEQEAAIGCYYGDTILPGAVAVGASWQARGGAVTVVLVPQEHFTFSKGVLHGTERRWKNED